MRRGFDYLIETALQRPEPPASSRKPDWSCNSAVCCSRKYQPAEESPGGLESLNSPAQEPADLDAIEQQLQTIEAELGQLRADSATLDKHLAKVEATLANQPYLQLEPVALTLDHMNIRDACQFPPDRQFDDVSGNRDGEGSSVGRAVHPVSSSDLFHNLTSSRKRSGCCIRCDRASPPLDAAHFQRKIPMHNKHPLLIALFPRQWSVHRWLRQPADNGGKL